MIKKVNLLQGTSYDYLHGPISYELVAHVFFMMKQYLGLSQKYLSYTYSLFLVSCMENIKFKLHAHIIFTLTSGIHIHREVDPCKLIKRVFININRYNHK